ncbi:GNAT family N-acetyltransferase [Amycolatopsis sp. NPDC059657]|uniref:GNAT family N-acetyltransferase n=1 Tax=Amycolatopsis sp. NPDC059657 TaxID=3346899 RepID=UPI00366BE988
MTELVLNSPDQAAETAAAASGVTVRDLAEVPDLTAVCQLFESIWQREEPGSGPVSAELLRAMVASGNYVSGAFDDGELVGACFGFFGSPAKSSLHSHIAGVAPKGMGRGLGFALKLHQRAWALRQDVTAISWTFDPLIRRNAYFNLTKLAADPAVYLPNFYGRMRDAINGSGDTDRLMVTWDLLSEPVRAAAQGEPRRVLPAGEPVLRSDSDGRPVSTPADAPVVLVGVPPDVEALRRTDPALGSAWRAALREVLHGLMADGARVVGFDRAGWYVVAKERS